MTQLPDMGVQWDCGCASLALAARRRGRAGSASCSASRPASGPTPWWHWARPSSPSSRPSRFTGSALRPDPDRGPDRDRHRASWAAARSCTTAARVRGLTTAASLWAVAGGRHGRRGRASTSWPWAARCWSSSRSRSSIGSRATRDAGCSSAGKHGRWRGVRSRRKWIRRISRDIAVHRVSRDCPWCTAARCARPTPSATTGCCSSPPIASRPSTSSSTSRSPTRAGVLTQLSAWWFEQLGRPRADPLRQRRRASDLPGRSRRDPSCAGRSMLVRRAERIDAECVVRGYLAGSGWAEYQRSGQVVRASPAGRACARPIACRSRSSRRRPRRRSGHDENITREQLADMVGADARAPARGALAGALPRRRASWRRGGRPDPGRHQVRVRRGSTASSR